MWKFGCKLWIMQLRWKIAQWFELQWWKGYLRDKNKTDYVNWKRGYWNDILENVPPKAGITTNKTIIDFGCGPAGIFIALPKNNIVAVDPLIDDYEKQTSFFNKSDYPKVTFIKSTIEEFDPTVLRGAGFPVSGVRGCGEQTFDYVFCMNVINHVQNIKKGFEKLKEVCADEATIIISIDAHNFSLFKYMFRLIPGDILHPHQYDLNEYKELLAADGWKITTTRLLKKELLFDHYLLMAVK